MPTRSARSKRNAAPSSLGCSAEESLIRVNR
jgi:hypothetical protein